MVMKHHIRQVHAAEGVRENTLHTTRMHDAEGSNERVEGEGVKRTNKKGCAVELTVIFLGQCVGEPIETFI